MCTEDPGVGPTSITLTKKTVGLVLAAGASTRMGRPKQLLPLKGAPLIYMVLKAALDSKLDKVVLILGHAAHEIRKAIFEIADHPKLEIVVNPNYQEGLSSSIKTGLKTVQQDYDHVMIILGDMPYIDTKLINSLLDKYFSSKYDLGAVLIEGHRTHPVIINRSLYSHLCSIQGDVGGKRLFELSGIKICFLNASPNYQHIDIDTPQDYMSLLKQME